MPRPAADRRCSWLGAGCLDPLRGAYRLGAAADPDASASPTKHRGGSAPTTPPAAIGAIRSLLVGQCGAASVWERAPWWCSASSADCGLHQ